MGDKEYISRTTLVRGPKGTDRGNLTSEVSLTEDTEEMSENGVVERENAIPSTL